MVDGRNGYAPCDTVNTACWLTADYCTCTPQHDMHTQQATIIREMYTLHSRERPRSVHLRVVTILVVRHASLQRYGRLIMMVCLTLCCSGHMHGGTARLP